MEDMHKGARAIGFIRAQALREKETRHEAKLWERLKGKGLGVKFRRQHPLSNYILDFYCHSIKLAIEVDGPDHSTSIKKLEDEVRDSYLNQLGITVLRITNEQIETDVESVVQAIKDQVEKVKASAPPNP